MKFGILGNIVKPNIAEVAGILFSCLRNHKLSFVVHDLLAQSLKSSPIGSVITDEMIVNEHDLPAQCDMLIALGGDGTMLAAARMVGEHQIPILGVNLGKLGFLAEVSVEEMCACIDSIVRGDFRIEDRMVLTARTANDGKVFYALNEIVVDRGSSARVIELETFVNDEFLVTYAADGILVTTPTGSTAYSLASGGPIVTPGSAVITVNPISPHTLTARPVIVSDTSIVRVSVRSKASLVHITADGQIEAGYVPPVEFTIRKAPFVVKLVKRKNNSYFGLLRAKLFWGRDPRLENQKK